MKYQFFGLRYHKIELHLYTYILFINYYIKVFLKENIYLFIWLRWVLVATYGTFIATCRIFVAPCGIFSCGMRTLSRSMWDLVPWPGIEPGPPASGAWSLNCWTTREVPILKSLNAFYLWIISVMLFERQARKNEGKKEEREEGRGKEKLGNWKEKHLISPKWPFIWLQVSFYLPLSQTPPESTYWSDRKFSFRISIQVYITQTNN